MAFKKHVGFTLVEFVITMALAAILLTVVVPSYYSMIQNNKAVSVVNNLSSGLHYARMEAIRRGLRVSVCSASSAALNACGSAAQWPLGWIVFLDENNNNLVDSNTNLLKVYEGLPSGTTVTANNSLVSYDSSGFVTSGAFTMTVSASGCTGNNARTINLSTSGRLSIVRAACN